MLISIVTNGLNEKNNLNKTVGENSFALFYVMTKRV